MSELSFIACEIKRIEYYEAMTDDEIVKEIQLSNPFIATDMILRGITQLYKSKKPVKKIEDNSLF